jgi:hypothetical protein
MTSGYMHHLFKTCPIKKITLIIEIFTRVELFFDKIVLTLHD